MFKMQVVRTFDFVDGQAYLGWISHMPSIISLWMSHMDELRTSHISFDSLISSTLTLSIDTFLRDILAKSLSHHTHICEEAFWYLGSYLEGTNSFWLIQWVIARSSKLEKIRFSITLLKQEAWRA